MKKPMKALDMLMAVGGIAFLIAAGGIYLLFSTGILNLPGGAPDFMEALQPGLENVGYSVLDVRSQGDARLIFMEDDQAEFVLGCRKDPTKSFFERNASIVYEGETIEGSPLLGIPRNLVISTFYEKGYLCTVASRSSRARTGVSEIRDIINEYGTVIDA